MAVRLGLVLHIVWGGIQAGAAIGLARRTERDTELCFRFADFPATGALQGFAYEPSWLAGQLAALYLPWLFAAVLTKYRLSKFKWLEIVLLLFGGILILLLTYSRGGLFITVGAVILTFLVAGSETRKAVWNWYRAGFRREAGRGQLVRMQAAGGRIVLSLILIGALIGAGTFLADKGYIAALWNSSAESLWDYAIDAYLGPRLAYVVAALESFQSHPFTGVGLGASGFTMYANMPDWSLSGVPEIARQLSPSSNLYPNPKNLYVRLLAETGLPGYLLYISFLFTMLAYALKGLREMKPFWRSSARRVSSAWLRSPRREFHRIRSPCPRCGSTSVCWRASFRLR
jgi:O-antigen ligase